MRYRLLTKTGLVAAFVLSFGLVSAEEKVSHDYVGAKKCKTCHKKYFKAWSKTGHAKAYDLLSDEEKKNEECVGCHITGTTAKGVLLEGVQCERCHGPASDYKSMKIMSKKKWKADPEKYKKLAVEAGLLYPTEETCVECHNKKSPNYKEFKFAERVKKVHPISADTTGK
ncbi:MAG: multiheme c-type cytochrome [Candidatus Zixiibacteriota bacterium]